jgi:DNA-nicking Smr family endonuclease
MPSERRLTPEEERLWLEARSNGLPLPVFSRREDRALVTKALRPKAKPPASLDLHGYTLTEAHQALAGYLAAAQAAGLSEVLLVTGKGRNSPMGQATLRSEVPRWLAVPPLAQYVRAVVDAAVEQGGRGALLVTIESR